MTKSTFTRNIFAFGTKNAINAARSLLATSSDTKSRHALSLKAWVKFENAQFEISLVSSGVRLRQIDYLLSI
jgi:hypothetical protein